MYEDFCVKVKEIKKGIIHLDFPSQHLMNSTLIRFQENYESPEFKNKIFTLEEYMDWYAKEEGKFDYFYRVYGLNFPSYVTEKFFDGSFDPLTLKEQNFIVLLKELGYTPNSDEKFYIIGTAEGNQAVLKHEVSHAMFYLNKEYQSEVLSLLEDMDISRIKQYLKLRGYDEEFFNDEANAFILSGIDCIVDVLNLDEKDDGINRIMERVPEFELLYKGYLDKMEDVGNKASIFKFKKERDMCYDGIL